MSATASASQNTNLHAPMLGTAGGMAWWSCLLAMAPPPRRRRTVRCPRDAGVPPHLQCMMVAWYGSRWAGVPRRNDAWFVQSLWRPAPSRRHRPSSPGPWHGGVDHQPAGHGRADLRSRHRQWLLAPVGTATARPVSGLPAHGEVNADPVSYRVPVQIKATKTLRIHDDDLVFNTEWLEAPQDASICSHIVLRG